MKTRIRIIEIETEDEGVLVQSINQLLCVTLPQGASALLEAPEEEAAEAAPEDPPALDEGRERPAAAEVVDTPAVAKPSSRRASAPRETHRPRGGPRYHSACGASFASWDHREKCLGKVRPEKNGHRPAPAPAAGSTVTSSAVSKSDPCPKPQPAPTALTPPEVNADLATQPDAPDPVWPEHSDVGHEDRVEERKDKGYAITSCLVIGCPYVRVSAETREAKISFFDVCRHCRRYVNSVEHLKECTFGPRLRL